MAKNKQWKAIQVDWPTLQNFSDDVEDYAYYKLTPRQAAFCQAWLDFGNWESRWVNLGESMDGIQAFVALTSLNLMIENSIMIDCEEVEECLVVSPIIINLNDETTINTTNITTNTTEITNNWDTPQDGNFYDTPSPAPQTDEACQISGYVANRIGDYIAQIDTYSTEPSLLDALDTALDGQFHYAVDELVTALNNFFVGGALPLFPVYDDQVLDVQTQMYCENDFSKDNLAVWAVGNLTRGQEISDMLNSVSLATWERWQQLGQYETIYDCTDMCEPAEWCYEFNAATGWAGWNIIQGDVVARGIDTEYASGTHEYMYVQAILDLTGITNIDVVLMDAYYIEYNIKYSSLFFGIQPDGGGTGQYTDTRIGYYGTDLPRSHEVDCSDWQGVKITIQAGNTDVPLPPATMGYVISVRFHGTGVNPFGVDNC